jgi:lipopolysaccharide export system permease protein
LGRFDPTIALWGPFLLFGGSIVWMYYTLAHKPGGQPIGALERLFARIAKLVGRLLRRRRRAAAT